MVGVVAKYRGTNTLPSHYTTFSGGSNFSVSNDCPTKNEHIVNNSPTKR